MRKIYEVVRTFDVEPFQAWEGEAFRFRLEVVRQLGEAAFLGKVYRLETYRLQPTFPQCEGILPDWMHDAMIWVADEVFDPAALLGASEDEVVAGFQRELIRLFG